MPADGVVIENETGRVVETNHTPPPTDSEITAQQIKDMLTEEEKDNQILQGYLSPNIQTIIAKRNQIVTSARSMFNGMPAAAEMTNSAMQEDQLMADLQTAEEIAGLIGTNLTSQPLVSPLDFRKINDMDTAFVDKDRLGVFARGNNGINVTLVRKTDKYQRKYIRVFPQTPHPLAIARNAVAALASTADKHLSASRIS